MEAQIAAIQDLRAFHMLDGVEQLGTCCGQEAARVILARIRKDWKDGQKVTHLSLFQPPVYFQNPRDTQER